MFSLGTLVSIHTLFTLAFCMKGSKAQSDCCRAIDLEEEVVCHRPYGDLNEDSFTRILSFVPQLELFTLLCLSKTVRTLILNSNILWNSVHLFGTIGLFVRYALLSVEKNFRELSIYGLKFPQCPSDLYDLADDTMTLVLDLKKNAGQHWKTMESDFKQSDVTHCKLG